QATGVGSTTGGRAEIVDRLITPRRCVVRLEHVIGADGRTTYFHIGRLVLLPLGEKRLEPDVPVRAECRIGHVWASGRQGKPVVTKSIIGVRERARTECGGDGGTGGDGQQQATMIQHWSPPVVVAFTCNRSECAESTSRMILMYPECKRFATAQYLLNLRPLCTA